MNTNISYLISLVSFEVFESFILLLPYLPSVRYSMFVTVNEIVVCLIYFYAKTDNRCACFCFCYLKFMLYKHVTNEQVKIIQSKNHKIKNIQFKKLVKQIHDVNDHSKLKR